jgi:hypothetical protein
LASLRNIGVIRTVSSFEISFGEKGYKKAWKDYCLSERKEYAVGVADPDDYVIG